LRRRKEVSIRAALGAGRSRLLRQFLLEGFVLAAVGGLTGLVLSRWIARLLIAVLPIRTPIVESAHLDVRVIAFTITLSLFSATAFAIIPALKGSTWTLSPTLSVNSIAAGDAWRHLMIAVEAALSLFLLCAAVLIAQNLWNMISAPAGFNPHNLLVMQVPMAPARQRSIRPIPSVAYRDYLEKIAAIPQVDAAAVAQGIPLRPRIGGFVRLVDEPAGSDPNGGRQIAWFQNVSPDYFETFGIPLLQGRTFRDDDIVGRPRVAIVNEKFLSQHSIASNPIGRQIDDPDGPFTIVGVVANTRTRFNPPTPEPQVYISYLQFFGPNVPYIIVKSPLTKAELLNRVKVAIRSSNEGQSVFNVLTMDEFLSNSVAEPRFNTLLVGAFALAALAMAATGMYSVIACLVSQRTSEIALRVALGARQVDVIVTVLGKTCVWVFAGLLGGMGLSIAVSNTIRHLSNSATAGSPLIYSLAFVIFLTVTVFATYVPLRRALAIDPTIALRCE
jgi:putative ABC transport system permease protein